MSEGNGAGYGPLFQEDPHSHLRNKLGTLNGVYVPCLLNIMGVILFLRLGWSVGEAGVLGTILIFIIAEVQTVLTVFSLSAIVTNGSMRGGGSYYMISRSLGPELGGAIGILFYLAYAVGASFYSIGFATELQTSFFPQYDSSRFFLTAISSLVLLGILIVSLVGAKFFTKFNVLLFILQAAGIIFALFSMWIRQGPMDLPSGGVFEGMSSENLKTNFLWDYSDVSSQCENSGCSFRKVFSIVFPAATGIMEGANLSGDLKDPKSSIGKGTLLAIFTSFLTYLAIIFSEGSSFTRETLKNNMNIMQETSPLPNFVVVAILVSTSSSALGSVFGGSRILQAICKDNLFPYTQWLGVGSHGADEPRRAALVTWLIAQGCVLLFVGDLDTVAPFITSLFCLSYALTNFAALLLRVSGVPNFRPGFKFFSPWTACIGGVANIAVMFWLNVWYGIAAVAVLFCIYLYLSLSNRTESLRERIRGDVGHALIFHQVRKYLLLLDEKHQSSHGKLWRPSILLFIDEVSSEDAESSGSYGLLDFCNSLKKGGLYVLGGIILSESAVSFEDSFAEQEKLKAEWMSVISGRGIKAFPQISVGRNARMAYQNLLLVSGLGALSPNTVVLPFYTKNIQFEIQQQKLQKQLSNHSVTNETFQMPLSPGATAPPITLKDFLPPQISRATDVFPSFAAEFVEEQKQPLLQSTLFDFDSSSFSNATTGFLNSVSDEAEYLDILKDVIIAGKHLLIARNFSLFKSASFNEPIDVWLTDPSTTANWESFCKYSLATLQFAYSFQRSHASSSYWFPTSNSNRSIRVFRVVETFANVEIEQSRLRTLLDEARLPISEVHVVSGDLLCGSRALENKNSAIELNSAIRCHSSSVESITFISLPTKSLMVSEQTNGISDFSIIESLSTITSNAGRTVMVFSNEANAESLMSREL